MQRKQVFLNIGANFLSAVIGLSISFLLTPFIVSNIGSDAYSFVPISSNFTNYMAIITLALTSMTSRFVTINVHKNNMVRANEYYSTSVYSNFLLSGVISVIMFFIIIFLDRIINIPMEIMADVRLLFIFMFLTFLANLGQSAFLVPAFSMNRLDITSFISIFGSIVRILVLVICFTFFRPNIYYIGLSAFIVSITQGVLHFYTSRKVMPSLKAKFHQIKIGFIVELFSSGVWNSFNQLSNVLLTGLDLLIANIILGSVASGILAVAKTVPIALQTLSNVLPLSFHSYLTILYAKESRTMFLKELKYTLKFSSLLLGIPIAGFIALASVFLKIWVPSIASQTLTTLVLLTMISMVANFSTLPLQNIFTITNKLKWPSIAIFITGILNVSIVFLLINFTNYGLYAIAGVSSLLEIVRSMFFIPIYAAFCLNEKKTVFYPSILKSLVNIGMLIAVFIYIVNSVDIHSLDRLLYVSILFAILGLFIGINFMLNREEKHTIWAHLSGFFLRERL